MSGFVFSLNCTKKVLSDHSSVLGMESLPKSCSSIVILLYDIYQY